MYTYHRHSNYMLCHFVLWCSATLQKLCYHTSTLTGSDYLCLASFPGLPQFCSSVCICNNTWKWKSGKKQRRLHHLSDIEWTYGGQAQPQVSLNTVEQSCLQSLESPLAVKCSNLADMDDDDQPCNANQSVKNRVGLGMRLAITYFLISIFSHTLEYILSSSNTLNIVM